MAHEHRHQPPAPAGGRIGGRPGDRRCRRGGVPHRGLVGGSAGPSSRWSCTSPACSRTRALTSSSRQGWPARAIESGSCEALSAVVHVLSGGTAGWADVEGVPDGTGFRFVIPGSAVAEDGFSYWMEFAIEGGGDVQFPEGGAGVRVPCRDDGGIARGRVAGRLRSRGCSFERRRRSPTAVRRWSRAGRPGRRCRRRATPRPIELRRRAGRVDARRGLGARTRARALAARRRSPLGAVAGGTAGRPRRGSGGRARRSRRSVWAPRRSSSVPTEG